MAITESLIETAQKLKSMGVLKVTLTREAEPTPGGPDRPAWLRIETDIDQECGKGKHGFTGHFYTYAHHDLLNATLRLVGDMIENAGLYGAILTNAIEDKRAAERRAEIERKKAAGVLDGKRGNVAFGDVFIEITDGAVWMLDPVKRGNGFGFRFDSLDELWRAHPNLRPVSWTDEGIICRPFSMNP